jgi:hypothetical protein
MIRSCATLGCATLTLGGLCLACEQKQVKTPRTFVRGRPYPQPAPRSAVAAQAAAAFESAPSGADATQA